MRLAKMLQGQTGRTSTALTDADVPRTFTGFLEWVGIKPRPGQLEFIRVAYDGLQPVDVGLAERIFGRLDFENLPMGLRAVIVGVCGGRAGKSFLLVAARLVWGMLVRDLSPLALGEEAAATVVAPREELRQQVINFGLGVMCMRPELQQRLILPQGQAPEDKPSWFGIYRKDFKREVMFEGQVAARGGMGVRGKWHTDLALDEAAFFRDATYKINDEEIFKAGRPRVLQGGQLIVNSTPYAKVGLLYELFRANFGKPQTALVAHAPTLVLNDDPYIREQVAAERKRDPDNAKQEFDAEFLEAGTTVFFETTCIEEALTDEPFTLRPGDIVAAGGDFGFRSDSSALLMVALRGSELHVFDGVELRPEDGRPLRPGVTVAAFAKCIGTRCSYLMADQHYREAITEHLETHNLVYAAAPMQPADTYVRTRMLLREGRVKIHALEFRDRMVQQMREVQGKPTSGGGMSIVHPRWAKGGHGDLVAALVLALWQVSGDTVPIPEADYGSKRWEMEQKESRRKALEDKQNAAWWSTAKAGDRGTSAWWKR